MIKISSETYCDNKCSTLTWKIPNFFKTLKGLKDRKISSQDFVLENDTYQFEGYASQTYTYGANAYQNHDEEPQSLHGFFNIDLLVIKSAVPKSPDVNNMHYCVALLKKGGSLGYSKEGWVTASFTKGNCILCVSVDELMYDRGNLVPNGTMTIISDFFSQRFIEEHVLHQNEKAESTSHLDDLSTDMAKLLKEPSTADFIIRIQEKDIPVHSVILCARSSVFKAMLSNEYKEKQINVVEINDVTSPAMCNFLEYVYTGSLTEPGSMSTDLLMEVYAVADKYNVVKLKDMCAQFLLDKLSEDNMEKFVRIADKHNDHKMLDSIADFVARRQEILDGEKWKRLSENVPTFGFRVLNGVLKRRRLI